jgi:hypothetical protein
MNAALPLPDRFTTFARDDLTEREKLRRVNVEVALIGRFRRSGKSGVSFRCSICGGRVDVEARTGAAWSVGTGSIGACRTARCIAWEE